MKIKSDNLIATCPSIEKGVVEENKIFPPMIQVYGPNESPPMIQAYGPNESPPMIQVFPKKELLPMIQILEEEKVIVSASETQEQELDLNNEQQTVTPDDPVMPCFSEFVRCDSIDRSRILDPFPENDIGRAERVLSSIDMELVYDEDEDQLRHWENGYWSELSEREFQKNIIEALKLYCVLSQSNGAKDDALKSGMYTTIKSIAETIKSMLNKKGIEFNKSNRVVCVKNGVYDFNRRGLFTHENYKNSYITYRLDYCFMQVRI